MDKSIESLDEKIAKLLEERVQLIKEMNAKDNNGNLFIPKGESNKEWLKEIFEVTIKEALKELKPKISIQGEKGSFTDEALKHFIPSAEPIYRDTFQSVFEDVVKGKAEYGFVPLENTTGGSVGDVWSLFHHYNVYMLATYKHRIVHNLIGIAKAKINDIKEVYSHPQALIQCSEYLTKKGLKPIKWYDTAGAVKDIMEKDEKENGAIASKRAAEIYNAKILEEDIGPSRNYTRFALISTKMRENGNKTALILYVHHEPGALLKALKAFDEENINLTRLESRPMPNEPWEYFFAVEFDGSLKEERVKRALGKLNKYKVLGSYEEG